MAKPLKEEEKLYDQIKREKISVHPLIWNTLYHDLGDCITIFFLTISTYTGRNEAIPLEEVRKLVVYVEKARSIVNKITHCNLIDNDSVHLIKLKDQNTELHPVIKLLYDHYIRNDLNCIEMCVKYYLDPLDPQPIPFNDAQKILEHTVSISRFMTRLREATTHVQVF